MECKKQPLTIMQIMISVRGMAARFFEKVIGNQLIFLIVYVLWAKDMF